VGLIFFRIFSNELTIAAIAGVAAFVPVLSAPIISMFTGLITGLHLDASAKEASLTSGVGSFIGFFSLIVVLSIGTAIAFAGIGGETAANGSGDVSSIGIEFSMFGLGVATTAAATTYVVKQFGG